MTRSVRTLCLSALPLLIPALVAAQPAATSPAATTSTAQAAQLSAAPDPDARINIGEPDFTLSALPTTLRMPAGKFVFRLTHRFTRPIASGSAAEFFESFFGMDDGAQMGFELRYGIVPGTQATLHRTSDRAVQILGQHQLFGERGRRTAIDALVAIEGADNFSDDYAVTLGGVLSYQWPNRAAFYVQPLVVLNSNPLDSSNGLADDTLVMGLGTRVRLAGSRVYVLAEVAPQVSGYDAGVDHVSFGLERRAGGHVFQLTVTNTLGTTMRQLAQGGARSADWFLGFNLTRRFF